MKTDILAQLVFATNGVGLRTFAKQLGWNDLMSLSRELQVLQAEGFVRFSGGRWKATPKGKLSINGPAAQPSVVNKAGVRPAPRPKTEPKRGEENGSLTTIAVQARRRQEAMPDGPSPAHKKTFAVSALLSYYRACLAAEDRNDPRADWDEAGDRFVPIRLSGALVADGRTAFLAQRGPEHPAWRFPTGLRAIYCGRHLSPRLPA